MMSENSEEVNEVEMNNLDMSNSWANSILVLDQDSFNTKTLKTIKASERTHFQSQKLAIIVGSFLVLLIVSLIRKNQMSAIFMHIEQCSAVDFILCLAFVIVLAGFLYASIDIVKKEYDIKKRVSYNFTKGDIQWENPIIIKLVFIALGGGMLASLVGLGGGVIFNPVILEFGVHPRVSSSTSMYLVMLNSMAATIQFAFSGILPIDYAIGLGIIIVIFTLIGNYSLNSFVRRLGKPSVLALFLAGVIILCTIIVLITSVVQIMNKFVADEDIFGFKSY